MLRIAIHHQRMGDGQRPHLQFTVQIRHRRHPIGKLAVRQQLVQLLDRVIPDDGVNNLAVCKILDDLVFTHRRPVDGKKLAQLLIDRETVADLLAVQRHFLYLVACRAAQIHIIADGEKVYENIVDIPDKNILDLPVSLKIFREILDILNTGGRFAHIIFIINEHTRIRIKRISNFFILIGHRRQRFLAEIVQRTDFFVGSLGQSGQLGLLQKIRRRHKNIRVIPVFYAGVVDGFDIIQRGHLHCSHMVAGLGLIIRCRLGKIRFQLRLGIPQRQLHRFCLCVLCTTLRLPVPGAFASFCIPVLGILCLSTVCAVCLCALCRRVIPCCGIRCLCFCRGIYLCIPFCAAAAQHAGSRQQQKKTCHSSFHMVFSCKHFQIITKILQAILPYKTGNDKPSPLFTG